MVGKLFTTFGAALGSFLTLVGFLQLITGIFPNPALAYVADEFILGGLMLTSLGGIILWYIIQRERGRKVPSGKEFARIILAVAVMMAFLGFFLFSL